MTKRLELSGKKFHLLQVVEFSHMQNKNSMWRCICECGAEKVIKGSLMISGLCKSCGCFNSSGKIKHGHTRRSLQSKQSSTYSIWLRMISRCENPKDPAFKWYGARGIMVCSQWHDFENFLHDMGSRPDGLTIDRRNNDGPYALGNCRWVSMKIQAINRRGKLRGTSRFKGVIRFQEKCWRARIRIDNKLKCLGLYADEETAARAYNSAALEAWGADAYLNTF